MAESNAQQISGRGTVVRDESDRSAMLMCCSPIFSSSQNRSPGSIFWVGLRKQVRAT